MEPLTTGRAFASSRLELGVQEPGPQQPVRQNPQGQSKVEPSADADTGPFTGEDLHDQVAAIEKLRASVSALESNRLSIDRHEDSGHFIYRIINEQTGETIRKWPPDSYLDLVAFLRDGQAGLIDEQA